MTTLEVLVQILSGTGAPPVPDVWGGRDPADGRGWILGAAILAVVFFAVLIHLILRAAS